MANEETSLLNDKVKDDFYDFCCHESEFKCRAGVMSAGSFSGLAAYNGWFFSTCPHPAVCPGGAPPAYCCTSNFLLYGLVLEPAICVLGCLGGTAAFYIGKIILKCCIEVCSKDQAQISSKEVTTEHQASLRYPNGGGRR